jgi:hypothetical protein
MHLLRRLLPGVVSLALLLPASAAASTPNGGGLFPHSTTCGVGVNATPTVGVDMLLTSGSTLWIIRSDSPSVIPVGHYAIASFTRSDGVSGSFGNKAGLDDTVITCSGTIESVTITSIDYLIG